jgi:tetratricopeptide (TPR) repeat protein
VKWFCGAGAAIMLICAGCASQAASAEEYYTLGMAYYELGKFDDAERWLSKASTVKKTMNASTYNLGRIAYETGRYSEAAKQFERLVKADPENIMAIKSAAYTEIMLGNFEKAESYYFKLLQLEPESASDGYNHALILYALNKYNEAEAMLRKFSYAMPENKNTLLLLARTQRALNKIEALDTYALWLANNSDALVRHEYALLLVEHDYLARAIEAMRKVQSELTSDLGTLKRNAVQFELARLLLIADPENPDGLQTMRNAINSGFNDVKALNELINDPRISKTSKTELLVLSASFDKQS